MQQYLPIGPHAFLPVYNLCIGLGIAISMLLLQYDVIFKRYSEPVQSKIHLGLLISIVTGFVCAYLFDGLTQLLSGKGFGNAGLTLLGGLLGGLMLFCIYLKLAKINILQTLNLLTPYFAITHALGRVGCFFAGCCFGKPTTTIWGVVYPTHSIPFSHYHKAIPLHPTQLYEAFFVLFLFVLLIVYKPKNSSYLYLIGYSIFRFILEYLRADDRGTLLRSTIFTPSQILCTFILITCTALWLAGHNARLRLHKV